MPCVYNNKFVIIEQEKIVLQKDSLDAGLDLLKLWFDSAPGHQESQKPSLVSGGFVLCGDCIEKWPSVGILKVGMMDPVFPFGL